MENAKRGALEGAGFHVGDAKEFLGLSDAESQIVELRVALSQAVRRLRVDHELTQRQVAVRMKSSQSRVAKIEAASPEVSLDLMFSGLFALGGRVEDLIATDVGKKIDARP